MNKWVKLAIGVGIAFVVLVVGYYLFPKSYITLSIAPDETQLSIDGGATRNITTGSTILVIAGTHTYKVSHDQFDSSTITLTSGNNETKELLVSLNPQTDAARELLNTAASRIVHERVGAQMQDQGTKTLQQQYPVLAILPYTSHSFVMQACASQKYPNDSSKIAICVYADDPDSVHSLAEAALTTNGYKPSDYEIIYSTPPSTSTDFSPPNRGDD